MKTIARYDIKECSIEFRIRTWRDLNKIVPFAAESADPDPVIVASFSNEKEARAFLDTQESYVRFFSYARMAYCEFEEYILEENVYSVDEDGDEEWVETRDCDCSHMPESITFGCSSYMWNDARKRWIEIEEEEEEEGE